MSAARTAQRATWDRELSDARQRARADELRATHQLLDRVFARAAALLAGVEHDPAWLASLPAHLAEALAYLGPARGVVRCRPSLAPRLRELLDERGQVEVVESPQTPVVLIVEAADGSMEVDNTLIARLGRLRQRLSIAVLQELGR